MNEPLTIGSWGDEIVLIDFGSGETAQVENIRQIITFGDLAKKYSRDGDPYTHHEIEWNKKHKQILATTESNGFDGLNGLYWVDPEHEHLVQSAINQNHLHFEKRWIRQLPILAPVDCLPIELKQALETTLETEWGTIYCEIEDDYYPDEPGQVDSSHLVWMSGVGEWGGCGYYEGKLSQSDLAAQLFPLLDLAGKPSVLALKEALERHEYAVNAETVLIADQDIKSGSFPNFGQTEHCYWHCSTMLDDDRLPKWLRDSVLIDSKNASPNFGRDPKFGYEPSPTICSNMRPSHIPKAVLVSRNQSEWGDFVRDESCPSFTLTTGAARRTRALLIDSSQAIRESTVIGSDRSSMTITAEKMRRPSTTPKVLISGTSNSNGEGVSFPLESEPSLTVTRSAAKQASRMADGSRIVSLTSRALARLQTMPDWYELPAKNTLAGTGIGNGVPCELAMKLAADLKEAIAP